MKGPAIIPSIEELEFAYQKFQSFPTSLSEEYLARCSQWTRFDPRLMEQMISYFAKFWKDVSPVKLNQEIRMQYWPQALAVCLEQCGFLIKKEIAVYGNWKKTVTTGIEPTDYQSFFIGLRPFASKSTIAKALHPISTFEKWGYAEDELQISKITVYPEYSFSLFARENLLRKFVTRKKKFLLQDYLEICHHSLSIRQAQRDLKSFRWVKAVGNTKARYYLAKS